MKFLRLTTYIQVIYIKLKILETDILYNIEIVLVKFSLYHERIHHGRSVREIP